MLLIQIGKKGKKFRDKQIVHCRGELHHMCSAAGGFGDGGKVAWQGLFDIKYTSIGL